ncbi:Holliday junction resolvase [Candidatus Thiomargarita nelsonii]|uniref:Putative pre-16S rRNA nuclease n=1 Tax=Candidatus Thiomargarita nelsonii TaxID=1003181 RepID=A0A0A6PBG1_9GAMM|nr:Holliday junction resolvase [Candidatus Thiomargarita nelsonii]
MDNYLMGFDYGSKRIGVAVGQTLTATARPLAIVRIKNQQIDWTHITALIQEWQPDALVVGLPKHADGSDSTSTIAARRFSRQLQGRYQLPVHTIDERLSSIAAAQRISPNRKDLDAVAAQIILETWLSE